MNTNEKAAGGSQKRIEEKIELPATTTRTLRIHRQKVRQKGVLDRENAGKKGSDKSLCAATSTGKGMNGVVVSGKKRKGQKTRVTEWAKGGGKENGKA